MNSKIDDLKAKNSESLLKEIQRIALRCQEEIDERIRVLRAREDPKLWVETEYSAGVNDGRMEEV